MSSRALSPTAIALVCGVVYVLTACPYVLGGDCGEFATIGAKGGVAHPSGYPLYILWLRALSWLPARSPAHATALATAILGAAAVWMLARACIAWGASRESSAIVSVVFALSPIAWDLSTHAEVFALNVALAMAIVALAAPGTPPFGREEARVGLLGLAAGLGISNHHTIVLLAPIGLYGAIAAARRSGRPLVCVALGIGALAMGLLPYAYILYVARTTPLGTRLVWGHPTDLAQLVRHFLRSDFGTMSLSASGKPPLPVENIVSLARSLTLGLFGLPIIALGALLRARARPRAPLVALGATFLLAGPLFVSRFDLADRGVAATIAARFHLLPAALAAVLVSLGIDALVGRRIERFAAVIVVALGAARAAASWPDIVESQRPTVDRWMSNVFRVAPQKGVLLAGSDAAIGAFFYEKVALGKRPDLVLVPPTLLLGEWYPKQVSAELGFEIVRGVTPPGGSAPVLDTGPLVLQLLKSGRPVLAGDWFPTEIAESAPSYPYGPFVWIVTNPRAIPDPYALEEKNQQIFAELDLDATAPRAGTWSATLWLTYFRTWRSLANAFRGMGDADHAAACESRATRFTPRP